MFLPRKLVDNLLPRVHEVLAHPILALFALQHIISDVLKVALVLYEVVELDFGCFKPAVSIVNQASGHIPQYLELMLNKVDVAVQIRLYALLLDFKGLFQLLKALLHGGPEFGAPTAELEVHLFDLRLVDLADLVLVHDFIHVHEALGANLDLMRHIALHPHVMILVDAKESAIRTNALLVVDADDLQFSRVKGTHLICPKGAITRENFWSRLLVLNYWGTLA